jgi:hypothetical protein
MLDRPAAEAILAAVSSALKAGIPPGIQQAIAANAVALAMRELDDRDRSHCAELHRLNAGLAAGPTLEAANSALAMGIRDGTIDTARADLREHLILTVIEKLRIEQPGYPAFRALQEARGT